MSKCKPKLDHEKIKEITVRTKQQASDNSGANATACGVSHPTTPHPKID